MNADRVWPLSLAATSIIIISGFVNLASTFSLKAEESLLNYAASDRRTGSFKRPTLARRSRTASR
jgi:hypothetical protein